MPARITRHETVKRFPTIFLVFILLILVVLFYALTHQTLLTYVMQTANRNVEPICNNCNVIVISLDTLSALHLPCYGYDRNTAPYLCAFARDHVWFTNSYAPSFYTLPSHFSLFTSLYPSTHGVLATITNSLDPYHKTLTQVLQSKGYSTLYFGPTNNEEFPLDKGIGRGFDYVHPTYAYDRNELQQWYRGIDMLKTNQQQGKPTFLFLHTYAVHEPYLPGSRALHFTQGTIPDIPVTEDEYYTFTPDLVAYLQNFFRQNPLRRAVEPDIWTAYQQFLKAQDYATAVQLYDWLLNNDNSDFVWPLTYYYYRNNKDDPQKVAYMKALYDELIWQLDRELQTFFTSLAPLLKENTILVITADHGEGFMEHGELLHTTLYNEILRVPLIMSIPHVPERAVSIPVQGIDIYPTILRFLGLGPMSPIEGADLTASILGLPGTSGKRYVISELYDMVPSMRKLVPLKQKTIIDSRWKLYVKNTEDPIQTNNLELYDTTNDMRDEKNVAAQYPAVVRKMLKKLRQFMANHPVNYPVLSPKTPDVIQEEIRKQKYYHY